VPSKSGGARSVVCNPDRMGQQDFGQGRKMLEALDSRWRSRSMSDPHLASRTDEAGHGVEAQAEYKAETLKTQPLEEGQNRIGIDGPRDNPGNQPQDQQPHQK
jgi:hypothetical protein